MNSLCALIGGDWIVLFEQNMCFEPAQLLAIGRRQNERSGNSGDDKLFALYVLLTLSIIKTRADWNHIGYLSAHVHTQQILRHAIHMHWRLSSRLFFLFLSRINRLLTLHPFFPCCALPIFFSPCNGPLAALTINKKHRPPHLAACILVPVPHSTPIPPPVPNPLNKQNLYLSATFVFFLLCDYYPHRNRKQILSFSSSSTTVTLTPSPVSSSSSLKASALHQHFYPSSSTENKQCRPTLLLPVTSYPHHRQPTISSHQHHQSSASWAGMTHGSTPQTGVSPPTPSGQPSSSPLSSSPVSFTEPGTSTHHSPRTD